MLSLSWVWVSGKCFRGCSSEWWATAGHGSWPPCPPGTMITLTSGHCVQVYQHCTAVWLFTARLGPGQDSVQRKASDSLHSAVSSGARCKVVSQCCALCTALLASNVEDYFILQPRKGSAHPLPSLQWVVLNTSAVQLVTTSVNKTLYTLRPLRSSVQHVDNYNSDIEANICLVWYLPLPAYQLNLWFYVLVRAAAQSWDNSRT